MGAGAGMGVCIPNSAPVWYDHNSQSYQQYVPPMYPPGHIPSGIQMGSGADLLHKIAMRLHVHEGALLPFQHIHAYKVDETKAIVLVVQDKQHVVIEDEWALFPSDKLVTQLRLLAK